MFILSSESSSLLGSVSLHHNDRLICFREKMRDGSHSDALNTLIQECLTESKLDLSQIDVFATGLGPGSFTGIRVSFNTLKTFAYIYNKPFIGFDSLINLAYLNLEKLNEYKTKNSILDESLEFICAMNAFKNMVYIAKYKLNFQNQIIETIIEPKVLRVQEIETLIDKQALCFGDAFEAYGDYFIKKNIQIISDSKNFDQYPHAKTMGRLFSSQFQNNSSNQSLDLQNFHWSQLLPLYLRASEAEENFNGIKYLPL